MIKDVVMLTSIFLLYYMGFQVEKRSKRHGNRALLKLSIFYFALSMAILLYYIRDFYVHVPKLDLLFYRIGGTFQGLALLSIFLFSVDVFYSSDKFRKATYFLGILIFVSFALSLWTFALERKIQTFTLDEVYTVSRVFFADKTEKLIMTVIGIIASTLPILSFLTFAIREREKRRKALLYGTGILLIFAGSMLCYIVSPLLARTLYLIGALVCYAGFKTR